jgi:hypothetical protein
MEFNGEVNILKKYSLLYNWSIFLMLFFLTFSFLLLNVYILNKFGLMGLNNNSLIFWFVISSIISFYTAFKYWSSMAKFCYKSFLKYWFD